MRGSLLVYGVLAVGAAGCAGRAADRGEVELRRQRLAVERQALDDDLERLEVRLLAAQERVRFWQELKVRHESVAAVACANLDEHAKGIAILDERQREKVAALARKSRLAAARFEPPAGGPR